MRKMDTGTRAAIQMRDHLKINILNTLKLTIISSRTRNIEMAIRMVAVI